VDQQTMSVTGCERSKLGDLRDEHAGGILFDLAEIHFAPEFQIRCSLSAFLSHEDIHHNSRPKIKAMKQTEADR
jgi:hypothetical protein